MTENTTEYLLGQIDGKLDALVDLVKGHVKQDEERFNDVYRRIADHAEDINKAKGAKSALILAAGGVSGLVALVAAAAQHILK